MMSTAQCCYFLCVVGIFIHCIAHFFSLSHLGIDTCKDKMSLVLIFVLLLEKEAAFNEDMCRCLVLDSQIIVFST